ncbi:54S ribosomal protein L22, mitochondrial [Pichia californica]|uniref:54S ribosomal protein L22, mitochondrial n=1 Tax=Pichia californica TaxID=460514 RepID=A0A9P6WK55_9ASCO|nr:54S ribosomal protein L22, mitochondrial [[Candida] californica]
MKISTTKRFLATTNSNKPVDSLFSDLTSSIENKKSLNNNNNNKNEATGLAIADTDNEDPSKIQYIEPSKDSKLQEFLNPKPYLTIDKLLTPLKKKIYLSNIKKNGFFKNNDLIKLKNDNKSEYKLNLPLNQIEALEPSIYLRSWRIKSSVKKTNIVLRALKNLPLKKAITQLHFMEKKVSRDLVEMLERGIKDAEKMNYNVNDLYIAESWVHTDGHWVKRVDCKGRGRAGIFTFKWVSVRFLLKTSQTKKRLEFLKSERDSNKKVNSFISNGKIRGNAPGFYRW